MSDEFDEAFEESTNAPGTVTVQWHGLTLTTKPVNDWLFSFQYFLNKRGDIPAAVEAVFGGDALEQIMASGHTSLAEVTELFGLLNADEDTAGK